MTLSSLNILSIIELIFYAPATALVVCLCVRHSFRIRMGWIFLMIFCFIRITEASLQLNTITKPTDVVFKTVPITLSFVGIATLLLTLLGLINRLRIMIKLEYPLKLNFKVLVLVRVLTVLGLVGCSSGGGIAGGAFASTGVYKVFITAKVGTLLLIGSLVCMTMLTAYIASKRVYLHGNEKMLLTAIAISLPLLAIRIIYAILCTWTNKGRFQALGGDVAVMGCMSVLQEFLVVIIWEIVGLLLQNIPKDTMKDEKMKVVELWDRFNARCYGHRKTVNSAKLGMKEMEDIENV